MHENKAESPKMSSGKRDPGFVPIRRGLLEHLPTMSSNALKLYLFLHLKACWLGPKRGCVEASFDDMTRGNGWSSKTTQRAIDELAAKGYIEVERAANQYGLTRIWILKYDLEKSNSAVDKFDHSITVGVDSAVDSGVDRFDHSTDHSKPCNALSDQDLQAPKKVIEEKKVKNAGERDAVRRALDAERLSPQPFSSKEKKQKLTKTLPR